MSTNETGATGCSVAAAQADRATRAREADAAAEALKLARAAVAATEAAFERDASDAAWQQVQAARGARDRAELAAQLADKRLAAAAAALAAAQRRELEAQFDAARGRASRDAWHAAIAPELVALLRLDAAAIAAVRRVLARTAAQQRAMTEALLLAERLGVPCPRDDVSVLEAEVVIRKALAYGRPYNTLGPGLREPENILVPVRDWVSVPRPDEARRYGALVRAARGEADDVATAADAAE